LELVIFHTTTHPLTQLRPPLKIVYSSLFQKPLQNVSRKQRLIFFAQKLLPSTLRKKTHSAVALLSTGQEITVELEETADGFDISIPPFTPQPNLKPTL